MSVERVVCSSDAVFAIVITLLILPLAAEAVPGARFDQDDQIAVVFCGANKSLDVSKSPQIRLPRR